MPRKTTTRSKPAPKSRGTSPLPSSLRADLVRRFDALLDFQEEPGVELAPGLALAMLGAFEIARDEHAAAIELSLPGRSKPKKPALADRLAKEIAPDAERREATGESLMQRFEKVFRLRWAEEQVVVPVSLRAESEAALAKALEGARSSRIAVLVSLNTLGHVLREAGQQEAVEALRAKSKQMIPLLVEHFENWAPFSEYESVQAWARQGKRPAAWMKRCLEQGPAPITADGVERHVQRVLEIAVNVVGLSFGAESPAGLLEKSKARAYSRSQRFAVGEIVDHPSLGRGVVVEAGMTSIVVEFPGQKRRKLAHRGSDSLPG